MHESVFDFEARSANGELIRGTYKGTMDGFRSYVRTQGLTLIDFTEKRIRLKKGRFSDADFQSFVEELYYLLNSGMQMDTALKLLIKNAQKESVKEFLVETLQYVRGGDQLSKAIQKAQKKVDYRVMPLAVSIISSGEEVGNIAGALKTLNEYLLFKEKTASEVKQAMAYPTFLIIMSVLMVFFVFFVIVPKFTVIFTPKELENLPLVSRMVLKAGLYVNEHTILILTLTGLLALSIPFLIKWVKNNFHRFALKLPVIRDLVVYIEFSRIFNSLGIMLQGGIKIDKAIKQSIGLTEIAEIRSLLKEALHEIKKGNRLSEVFTGHAFLPPQVVSMVSVGENSAKLDEVFLNLSQRFSETFQKKTKKALSLLEPLVIVLMGLFIAVIVVAIMLAVISISDIT